MRLEQAAGFVDQGIATSRQGSPSPEETGQRSFFSFLGQMGCWFAVGLLLKAIPAHADLASVWEVVFLKNGVGFEKTGMKGPTMMKCHEQKGS